MTTNTNIDGNTDEELLQYAHNYIETTVKQHRKHDMYDPIYAFVLSTAGNIYVGKPLTLPQPQFDHCAERHAINQMQLEEHNPTIDTVLVAGPVPTDHDTTDTVMPCAACRHAIHANHDDNTTILTTTFTRQENDVTVFPEIDEWRIDELLPHPYANAWDNP